jgi:hypothetical protein
MSQNIEIINIAVRLIVKAAVLAAGFSGRSRKRSLKRLAGMDIEEKDKNTIGLIIRWCLIIKYFKLIGFLVKNHF